LFWTPVKQSALSKPKTYQRSPKQVLGFNTNLSLYTDENKIATAQKIINEVVSKKQAVLKQYL
jgi:hypothetical protein